MVLFGGPLRCKVRQTSTAPTRGVTLLQKAAQVHESTHLYAAPLSAKRSAERESKPANQTGNRSGFRAAFAWLAD
jgi:hypothetical protein